MSDTSLGAKFASWRQYAVIAELLLSHGRVNDFKIAIDNVDRLSKEIRSEGEGLYNRIENGKDKTNERTNQTPSRGQEPTKEQPGRKAKSKGRQR